MENVFLINGAVMVKMTVKMVKMKLTVSQSSSGNVRRTNSLVEWEIA